MTHIQCGYLNEILGAATFFSEERCKLKVLHARLTRHVTLRRQDQKKQRYVVPWE